MNTLELDLSSCEDSIDYYVNKLIDAANSDSTRYIDTMILEVDRGVEFSTLDYLLQSFPKLENLKIIQNYSPLESGMKEFLDFLKILGLKKFELEDLQSEFLGDATPSDLFKKLPNNCTYMISSKYSDKPLAEVHIDAKNNKSLVFNRGNC